MKVLVLQLARLGDILQTWPALRALKRLNPSAEIHVLARARFREAFDGLEIVDRIWSLDSKEILRPLAQTRPDLDVSLSAISGLAADLCREGFDQIINLSFSPVSSYLTRLLATESYDQVSGTSIVCGYTRHADGYLAIPDDASAYFYAQVGPDRPNRIHLSDLFAHIMGVELKFEDWQGPRELDTARFTDCQDAIVVHIGASQAQKTLSWSKWAQIVKGLLQAEAAPVVLIGAASESDIGARIVAACGDVKPRNLVGQTQFTDLFAVLANARLLVGGDSGPLHIASLVNTPVFNLSFPSVSFWETGPKSVRSRVVSIEDEAALPSDVCVQDILNVWREIGDFNHSRTHAMARTLLPSYVVESEISGYVLSESSSAEDFPSSQFNFQWDFTRAVYMGESFPMAPSEIFVEAVSRLVEVNAVALHQLKAMEKLTQRDTSVQILDRVDEVIEQIAKMVPDIGPLVRWFQTERLRMGPMPVDELISATRSLHLKFEQVLALYHLQSDQNGTDRMSERENEA